MPRALFLSSFSDGNLDAVELQGLHRLASKVDFPARKTIFSEGQPANFVFGLSKGYVRLYKSLADGRRQILSFALPGDFLGMPLRARHGLSADAIGDVVTCRFSRVEFSNFVQRSPNIIWRLNEFATRELERAQNLLLLVGNASAERTGPGCLNKNSASISGASAGVRPPRGAGEDRSRLDPGCGRQGSNAVVVRCKN